MKKRNFEKFRLLNLQPPDQKAHQFGVDINTPSEGPASRHPFFLRPSMRGAPKKM
jgi:hypothetical protein